MKGSGEFNDMLKAAEKMAIEGLGPDHLPKISLLNGAILMSVLFHLVHC